MIEKPTHSSIRSPTSLSRQTDVDHKFSIEGRDLTIYSIMMDAAVKAKAASIIPHFGKITEESVIVDVGSGTGQLAEDIANQFHTQVYAVDHSHDMLAIAEENLSKVKLVYDDACELNQIPPSSADIIYHGTVGHEIYSNYGYKGVNRALRAAYRSLKNDGKEVWRDFYKPAEGMVYLQILTQDGVDTVAEATVDGFLDYSKLSTKALFECFHQQFREGNTFNYEIVERDGMKLIKLPAEFAQEFILRKDYTANWRQEIKEKYAYWTLDEAAKSFENAGFSQIEVVEDDSEYIRNQRLKGKVVLYTEEAGQLKEIEFPTHMVVTGIKAKGEALDEGEVEINGVDYQSLADSIVIEDGLIKFGEKKLSVGRLLGQGVHKQVYELKNGQQNKVIKIVRKDRSVFNSAFTSIQQAVERQIVLEEMEVAHMKIYDYDREGPPYRYLIQEAIPEGSICAADLIKEGKLNEEDVRQMAEIINRFEFGRQWQINSGPFNWYRVNKENRTEMTYVGGTVYRYNEAWSFDKVGLLQWIDPNYVLGGQFNSAKIPTKHEAEELAEKWAGLDSKEVNWWKKYLNPNFQPGKN